jgi:transposase
MFVNLNGRSYNFTRTSVDSVRIYGRDGNDTITVLTEIPDLWVRGGAGNDILRGGPSREFLSGDDGDDLLDGGLGSDALSGGNGKDVVDYRSRTNALRLVGNQGGEWGERDTFGPDDQPAADAARKGIELSVVKLPEAKRGFVLLPRRWVVERSFAWAARFRRLARDYERLAPTLAGMHFVAFACVMLRRLASWDT